MQIEIVEKNNIDLLKQIEEFVDKHPEGNFFQSVKAFEFYNSVPNNESFFIIVLHHNDIVGSLQGVAIKENGQLKGFLSRRCIIEGGPLIKDNNIEVLELILEKLNSLMASKVIYTEFRNIFDLSEYLPSFNKLGYQFEEHLNIFIDLTKSDDIMWSEVHKKRRNEIKRATKEGTDFRILENKEELFETYNILQEVYDRAKLPLPPYNYFETAYKILGNNSFNIFLATYEGRIIGTMYTLCYRDTIYDWYAGSFKQFYKKYPNDLIPWRVFLWGKERKFLKFDFGGAGKPDVPYGVRDYKKRFGGEFVNFGRLKKINNNFFYKIGELGIKMLSKF